MGKRTVWSIGKRPPWSVGIRTEWSVSGPAEGSVGKVASRLMAEGLALQLQNEGDVLLRFFTDARIKGGNINLQRARELTGKADLTEEEMVSRAGEIVGLAGIQLRAYAEVQQKFNELVASFKPVPNKVGTIERARIERTNGGSSSSEGGDNSDSTSDGGNNEEDDNLEP